MDKKVKTSKKTKILTEVLKAYVQKKEALPDSLSSLLKSKRIAKKDIKIEYENLEELIQATWKSFMDETLQTLQVDETYHNYTVREKLLAFYYTHIEILKKDRVFIDLTSHLFSRPGKTPYNLIQYKSTFVDYIKILIESGIIEREIAPRKFISEQYHQGFWIQCLFILNYWLKDESAEAQLTDAAIEKSVKLSFELIEPGVMDSFIDFCKFLYQSR